KALEEPKLFAVHPPYIDDSTSEQMVRLYYKLPVKLKDLKIIGLESGILKPNDDSVKARVSYQGQDFWLHFPISYVKDQMVLMSAY
ncbi:uncharacterized protein P174DRAFT_367073, partial [Aspergillus novofumigatus IBT 16806]